MGYFLFCGPSARTRTNTKGASYNCRAASRVSKARPMIVFHSRDFAMYGDGSNGQTTQAGAAVAQALMAAALQPRGTLFSFLRSAAFRLPAVRSQSIGFRRSRHAPSHTLLCAGSMRIGQLLSVRIVRRFTLRAHNLYEC